ncbi:UDP-N-acetylmuramoyl-tripeptide--D-alanyl-D-alanine ligase [Enterococcus cecorum]|uniref:UDP-N-acetylmuramoyl-tripeptide--D-alanyl-D-alanine ligase n=1 Tax=Enterococcus cecorum TaxID=44008 RepID=A0AAP6IT28_9ENTE|nr:UDP-N-acetylmuramoyl-tripeptide--D-alanyl-D-alanine ligase [Enterococcus cecorum]MCJ0522952.1 UDP-N-acetylmuramoyl-tripeptide--D-alanyl-D-alanine ligase [Enterococcus cecorum]MCJ0560591.1 UDP-N-acetylmuramoyl-tripeptide--D-alanyl-D-alanine ligase [Enterococcus cecorum]MCJ0571980.1 UDP-N-acetylmuramoyl-tripeptide--D-alanyl-D-alanine ligase [Enterococcus cecorum]MCJ0578622.1 UDP-N-acetylmuramoyl-tripeptide--D-alanyl-D-alanine ligase [Enterococcus cecorum]MCJ0580179.1 UDP-N-acetylmuramoyl-trip
MKLTIKEIAQVLGISGIVDEREISSVEFDSRKIEKNDLFVPLPGTRDGHDFVKAAKENGAIATLWQKEKANVPSDLVVLPVEDVTQAFQIVAQYYKQKIAPKTVAITGSNGKTTTKDMTASVLAQKYRTYKTQGNYNNDLGVPYTMLHMPDDTEVLILEMGMDHAGEIHFLSQLGQPDVAAITLIGEAHLENLGSRKNIAKAKMEIVDGLAQDGALFVPADEPLLTDLIAPISQEVQTFGLGQGDLQAEIVNETSESTEFEINDASFIIPVLGGYNVKNALIAYGIGRYFGLSMEQIKNGLAQVELTKNRTQWLQAKNGAKLLSDVYNANPTAMRLVLESFGRLTLPGRRIAVLADMLELGPDSSAMHASMAEAIVGFYDFVYLYGEQMQALANRLTELNVPHAYFIPAQRQAFLEQVQKEIQPTDSVILKGSNGMQLSELVALLTE